jgi:hypothetical protein
VRSAALFQIVPRLLLPPTGHAWHSNAAARVARKRCQQFLSGEWRTLWADSSLHALHAVEYLDEEDAPCAADLPDASPDEASLEDKRYDAVIRLVARGRIKQANSRLHDNGTAPYCSEPRQARDKHRESTQKVMQYRLPQRAIRAP